jgi:hypothetical protein
MAGPPHDRSPLSGAISVTLHWSAQFVGLPWAEGTNELSSFYLSCS